MKLLTFFMLIAITSVTAKSYSQRTTLTFNLDKVNVGQVFKEIEKNSDYILIYNEKTLDIERKVTIKADNDSIETILDKVFSGTPNSYKIAGRQIVISESESVAPVTETGSPGAALQQVAVTGKVTDKQGTPLIGVTVLVKGTTIGVLTNPAGEYSLPKVPQNSTLVFSFIGMTTQEVPLNGRINIDVVMNEVTVGLQEVVVVGYGIQKKETVTGSVVSVGNKELIQSSVSNVGNALVGRVPGLVGLQSSGEPGDNAATINIRGIGTLNGSGQNPLVIIDGVESSFSIMNAIDANEIESISVLKDASATAVYGVRGANGVIILTTKRGKSGEPKISFSANFGITQLTSKIKMLGSYDYALYRNEAIRNDKDPSFNQYLFTDNEIWKFKNNRDYTPDEVNALNITPAQKTALLAQPALYYGSHDYFDEQFGAAPQRQYNLNISGGGKNVRYFTSLGYFSQDGNLKNSKYQGADVNSFYKRYNFRSNYDIAVLKNLKIEADLSGQFATNGGILGNPQDGDITGPYSRHKTLIAPILGSPPFDGPGIIDGKLVSGFTKYYSPLASKGGTGGTPISYFLSRPYLTTFVTNLAAKIKLTHTLDYLTKGLSVTGMASYNDTYVKGVYRIRPIPRYIVMRNPANPAEILYYGGDIAPTTLTDNYNSNKWRRLYFEGAANYNRDFGKHAVTGLVLVNAQKTFDPSLLYNVPSGLVGLVGRATYNYNQRYLAEINMGYNGSENFPKSKRFGFFPAFSAGWIISNEPFFPKNNWITWLKLRGSYGEVGNDQIGGRRFLYLPNSWGYGNNYFVGGYFFGNSNGGSVDPYYIGAYERTVGNPNVTWERAKKSNVSLEMNFLKNRLSFIGDVFQEKRDNILWQLGTVPATVAADLPPANIGKVSNRGYEIQMRWKDKIGEVDYGIQANLSYARNKIEYMDEPPYPYPWMNQTGFSIGQYKGLKSDGLYNTDAEASTRPYSNLDGNHVQAGDIRFVDMNGNGVIDANDKVPIGYSNLPRYAFNTTLSLGYKGFAATILFIGTSQGSFPFTQFYLLNPFSFNTGGAMEFQYDGRWTPEKAANGIAPTFPRASMRTFYTESGASSDFWLKSTDFIRLKNIELSYTFNKIGFLKRAGIEGIRLYVNGNNLYTWTKLINGIDPEQMDSEGGASLGYVYPMTSIYSFGINMQF